MIKILLMVLSAMLLMHARLNAAGETPGELYAKAADAYRASHYQDAQQLYEELIRMGYRNSEVYYNLANCYFKQGQIGRAILNYERARQLSPADEDILHNLQLAETKTVDKIQPVPQLPVITAWKNFVGSLTDDQWAFMAVVLLWVALLPAAVFLWFWRKPWLILISVLLALCSLFVFFIGGIQHRHLHNSPYAIILTTQAGALSAPDPSSTVVFEVHEGTKIRVMDEVSGWTKIRLEDGRVGWLQKTHFEKI
ncbi:MAG: tetratricopeptide repeat protein [Chitinophagales bacterium]|nr:tetratricopeptide repeat protein [Chitinophagales bacterium]MDW8418436.1 tetratricopeptide repeat protein [Chitinophagales bacterium]